MKKRTGWFAALGGVICLVLAGTVLPADAASSVVISRAPYVTDLTTSSAYVNWAIQNSQTAGSVIVQPQSGGKCPTAITWSTTKHPFATPVTDPLNGGQTPWTLPTVGTVTEWQASTPVTGLSPSTTYCYAVFPSQKSAYKQLWPTQSFTTLDAPGSSKPLTFDVIGDTGENAAGFNQGESNLYHEIGASGAKFLLEAGDIGYVDGSETDYGDLHQTGPVGTEESNVFGPSYFPLANGIPTFVADGNHGQNVNDLWTWPEPNTVGGSNGTYAMQAPAAVDGVNTGVTNPADWYALQNGNTRIYVLDAAWSDSNVGSATGSECPGSPPTPDCLQYQVDGDQHWQTSSPEYQWLASDLAAHPGGVKMAVFHYPVRSVNLTQPSDPYLSGLEALLAQGGVQVAFNGHAHTYQRIQPSAAGTVANFVTGGGGGVLEPVDTKADNGAKQVCNPMLAQATVYALGWNPNAAVGKQGSECSSGNVAPTPTSAMQVYNYLKVAVNGQVVTVTAVNAEGQAFDQATFTYGTKDTQPPTVPTGLATTSVTSSAVGLSWKPSTDNVGVAGYDVLRNGTQVGTTATTGFTDSTVAPGTSYQYTVEAFDAAGNNSGPGTPLPVTTPPGSPPPAVKFVQSAGAVGKTVSLASPAASGDLLVLSAGLYTGSTNRVTAVTDSAGDTWKPLVDAFTSGHDSDGTMWYTLAKGPVTSIGVTTATASTALGVQEFSGLGSAPGVTVGSGSSTGTAASASATGSGLVVGFVAGHAVNQPISLGAGYVAEAPQVTPSPVASLADGYALSGSSPTFGGTFAKAMYWSAGVAVFTAG